MIDRRKIKIDLENNPPNVSETEILLNFSEFLLSSYKYLTKIDAGSYDPFDEFVELNYFELVHKVLAYKFGVDTDYKRHHVYGFTKYNYRFINHIEVKPRIFPFTAMINGSATSISVDDLKNRKMVFKQFGDGNHNMTWYVEPTEFENVKFDLVEVDFFDENTGLLFKEDSTKTIWINKADLLYEYVLEDFDPEIHKFRRENVYAD